MKYLKYALLGLPILTLMASCEDREDELTSVEYARLFSPCKMDAKSVKESSAQLSWNPVQGATGYLVELYADDSLTFAGSPALTKTVTTASLAATGLVYDTDYSVKVSALDEKNASRNSTSTSLWFRTAAQQILNSLKETDIADRSVTMSWPSEEQDVSIIKILDEAGALVTKHDVTEEERAAGKAVVSGIEPETKYTAKLYFVNDKNIEKERGSKSFTTIADLNGAIVVRAEDNLKSVVEAAEDGAVLALYGGTFMISSSEETPDQAGSLVIDKNITIKGIFPTNIPTIKGRFELNDGATLTINQVNFDGADNASGDQCFNFKGVENMGGLLVENAEIKNYTKGVYYVNVAVSLPYITFNNCLIHDIVCDGGDMFDCRKGHIEALTFNNSTIYNSCASRDFIRYDDASASFEGKTSVITVNNCTIDGAANGGKRLLYVRYGGKNDPKGNAIVWKNNLVTNTGAVWSNQSSTAEPEFANNVYFGCTKLNVLDGVDGGKTNLFVDADGKTLDPQYSNREAGDFHVGNENVTKLGVGDSRWR